MDITLEQAKQLLKDSNRYELRDHYFGDTEVTFKDPHTGKTIAEGYSSTAVCNVLFLQGGEFFGEEALPLLKMGKLVKVERNDTSD